MVKPRSKEELILLLDRFERFNWFCHELNDHFFV